MEEWGFQEKSLDINLLHTFLSGVTHRIQIRPGRSPVLALRISVCSIVWGELHQHNLWRWEKEEGEKVWSCPQAHRVPVSGARQCSARLLPLFQPPPTSIPAAAAASGPDLVPRQALCLLSAAAAWAQCGAGSQEFKFWLFLLYSLAA